MAQPSAGGYLCRNRRTRGSPFGAPPDDEIEPGTPRGALTARAVTGPPSSRRAELALRWQPAPASGPMTDGMCPNGPGPVVRDGGRGYLTWRVSS